jgi:hypothetical protein
MAVVVYDLHNLFRYEMQLLVCQEPLSSDSLNFLQEEEALCKYGLTLYTLDRLYKAVELHAKKTTEWSRSVSAHFFFTSLDYCGWPVDQIVPFTLQRETENV